MSDPDSGFVPPPEPPKPTTAGGLLRQARQAQGLHIAALAAAIKVVPRKLELLESDQFDKLPDATFTRALAQTVCRTLKIDATPILALLPPPNGNRLGVAPEGLNAPFRERPGRMAPKDLTILSNPALWLVAVLVIGAVVVYLMPAGWLSSLGGANRAKVEALAASDAPLGAQAAQAASAAAASSAASGAAMPADVSASGVGSSPSDIAAANAQPSASVSDAPADEPPPPPGVLQLHASAQSWVEVTDSRGQSLISRVLEPGEDVGLDGVMPLKIKIGNAGATQVTFRGEPVELPGFTRDNVARFELK